MTKSELIKRLAQAHSNLYQKDLSLLVNTVLEEISAALSRGDRVELRGFGSFSIRQRKARMARNPKTNEVVHLGERNALYFRAGKELRERLNESGGVSSASAAPSFPASDPAPSYSDEPAAESDYSSDSDDDDDDSGSDGGFGGDKPNFF